MYHLKGACELSIIIMIKTNNPVFRTVVVYENSKHLLLHLILVHQLLITKHNCFETIFTTVRNSYITLSPFKEWAQRNVKIPDSSESDQNFMKRLMFKSKYCHSLIDACSHCSQYAVTHFGDTKQC